MKRIRKLINSKWVKRLILATFLFHGITQLNYWRNDFSHNLFPSSQRTAFEKEFGFPIKGWKDEIEGDSKTISSIASVMHKEQFEQPFYIKNLRIKSPNYLEKSIFQQIAYITLKGYNCYTPNMWFMPHGDSILLEKGAPSTIIHHEIKHDKSIAAMKDNPEFARAWKELADDKNGNSLYLNPMQQICNRLRGLETIVDLPENYEELGFVSDYAATNIYEDMAELCELTESCPQAFVDWFHNPEKQNPIIKAKVRLAAVHGKPYGLIPEGFEEYITLCHLHHQSFADKTKANQFLIRSKKFLDNQSRTVYECELRFRMGTTLGALDYKEPAILQLKKALKADFKDISYYPDSLRELRTAYTLSGDLEKADILKKAIKEYHYRYDRGDVTLPRTGINDYLKEHGFDF
jgi:hypothetical protein